MFALKVLREAIESQPVSQEDIDKLRNALDPLFKMLKIDVKFTHHFAERCNDSRNGRQITLGELVQLFNKQYRMNGKKLEAMPNDAEGVLKDINTQLNIPVAFVYNPRTKLMELRCKTIMRKKQFHPNDPRDKVFAV